METLNENIFVTSINKRKPNKDGKIEVTEKEYDKLWDIILGDTNKECRQSIEDSRKWFKKSVEFANAYKCV